MTDNTQYPHTAIPIWSGFIYQGKVALYHVIRLLCEDKDNSGAIRLDSLEDFIILNDQEAVISLHQVKAQAEGAISSYNDSSGKSAFEKLKENAQAKSCDHAFMHLANRITDKTEEEINTEYDPVKLYRYNGQYDCAVNQIDSAIESVIRTYFEKYHTGEDWKKAAEHLSKARIFLSEIIQEQVLSTHMKGQRVSGTMRAIAATEKIDFLKILEILEADLSSTANNQRYYLYLIRQDLRRYYDEFVETIIEHESMVKKLTEYMIIIENLEEDDLIQFVKNITPHRDIKFNSLQEYRDNTLVQDEIHDAFFTILKEMKETNFNQDNNIFIWEKDKEYFYPTTIKHGQRHSTIICERIIHNALRNDLGLMFEKDYLITTDIEVESILDKVPRVNELDSLASMPDGDKRITNWKNVSLISLDMAKGELND